jgi:hypothetical protein
MRSQRANAAARDRQLDADTASATATGTANTTWSPGIPASSRRPMPTRLATIATSTSHSCAPCDDRTSVARAAVAAADQNHEMLIAAPSAIHIRWSPSEVAISAR